MRNKLKHLFTMLIVALIAMVSVFSSCKDDDENTDSSIEFKLPKTSITITAEGGSESVSVQGLDVTFSTTADWLTLKQETATDKIFKYTLSATANTTGEERSTTVTVSSKSGDGTIIVTQLANEILSVSPKNATFTKDGGNLEINVTATSDYEISISDAFITKAASKALKESKEKFSIAASDLPIGRSGKIIFKSGKLSDTVLITQEPGDVKEIISVTAMDIAKNMYPGWNLGNTMEATGGETSWQSTKTTQEIISYVKSLGFKSVRIPCSWYIHSSKSGDFTIDEDWMARVTEIVNYCISEGLYVLLNDHYDGDWIEEEGFKDVTDEKIATNCDIMKKLWTQIATNFIGYDEHLIFAGMNEPYHSNNSGNDNKTSTLIKYEQAFVDAVRATGGNNEKRILVVQGPATDVETTLSQYDITQIKDVAENLLMLEVHYYTPWNFCGMEADADWGKMQYYFGEENYLSSSQRNSNSYGSINEFIIPKFQELRTKFADKGYPIIIGEYACQWRDLSSATGENQDKHNASVKTFYKAISQYGPQNGMVPMTWDINYCNQEGIKGTMTLINRAKLEVFNTFAMEGITEGTAATVWMK